MQSRLVERYIIRAITPYMLLSLLLLTAILFIQQAGRFGDLMVATYVPSQVVWELMLSLIPSVLIFTLPMAILTGTLIGYSRMGSDSELVALRSAGVGTWKLLWPALLLGSLLTGVALYINLEMAPRAIRALRQTSIRAILYKLESPVEPRTFYTDIPGLVIYVRDGDKAKGQWGRVFLYMEANDGTKRLVTARSGRLDTALERSELVLQDVVLLTLPSSADKAGENAYISERLEQWRKEVDTGRKAQLEGLKNDEAELKLNEMRWGELNSYAAGKSGTEALEARTMIKKRLAQSLSPLVFVFLGASLGLRVRRGGRAIGIILSLTAMLSYYLLSLAGEQMARAGTLPEPFGVWLATTVMLALGLVFLTPTRRTLFGKRAPSRLPEEKRSGVPTTHTGIQKVRARLLGFPSLMDATVLRALMQTFAIAFISLVSIFLIFTLFELWRFIVSRGISTRTVLEYLFFLLPLAGVQLLPASVLIATLAAYALIARRSEAIAWWASGQSVYRLILPGIVFAAGLAAGMWFVQERLMPQANVKQDILRAQIRGGGGVTRATVSLDKQWLASAETGRLYLYEFAGDEKLLNLSAFEFDPDAVHLRRALVGKEGVWKNSDEIEIKDGEILDFKESGVSRQLFTSTIIARAEPPSVFRPTVDKPLHLSAASLSNHIKSIKKRGGETAQLDVALQRKYAEPFSPLIMALTGIPLALSFGRRSAVMALCLAVALGLLYWGTIGIFRQLGDYALLPPIVAAWAPLLIFAAIGIYLLARSRT